MTPFCWRSLEGSLCITGHFFLPPGFLSELATTLLLGSIGECSVVSLAWSDAAFLSRLSSLSSTNVRYTIWDWLSFQSYGFSYFVRVLVSCLLVRPLAGLSGRLLAHIVGRTLVCRALLLPITSSQ